MIKSTSFFGSMLMLMAFTFTSCVEDDDFTTKSDSKPNKESLISQTAIDFAKSINNRGVTRTTLEGSNHLHSISVQELDLKCGKAQTRSIQNAPQFYAVSLSANNGTVLVASQNDKTMPVAYFMKENNFDAEKLMRDSVSDLGFLVQTIINENSDRNLTAFKNGTDENTIIERIAPKCKVAWDQDAPYNRYCYTSTGQQAVAGCVAIAAGQALTVLQPNNFPGITSWEEIVKPYPSAAAIDEIAHLVRYIGEETNMNYGTESSGTKVTPSKLFKKYGIVDYDCGRVIDVLNTQHGVIYITGFSIKHGWGPWKHYIDGHAFIADGYIKYNRENDPYYLHLNYGWGVPYLKDVYLLSANKHWKRDEAKQIYPHIYPHKLYYYSYTYENEKTW